MPVDLLAEPKKKPRNLLADEPVNLLAAPAPIQQAGSEGIARTGHQAANTFILNDVSEYGAKQAAVAERISAREAVAQGSTRQGYQALLDSQSDPKQYGKFRARTAADAESYRGYANAPYKVAPPQTVNENIQDVAGGLIGFMGRMVATKKLLPTSIPEPIRNIIGMAGASPREAQGEGALQGAGLEAIHALPIPLPAKVALESGGFAALTWLQSGNVAQTIINGLLPIAIRTPELTNKYAGRLKVAKTEGEAIAVLNDAQAQAVEPTPTARNGRQTARSQAYRNGQVRRALDPIGHTTSEAPQAQSGETNSAVLALDRQTEAQLRENVGVPLSNDIRTTPPESTVTEPPLADASQTVGTGGAMGAASSSELVPGPTGTKNAAVELERDRRGLPRAVEPVPETVNQWDADAKAALARNPNAGNELVNSIAESPRSLSDRESALWLNHQTSVQNEYDATIKALSDAHDANDAQAVADLTARESQLSDQLLDIYDAGKVAGTEWGRGGVARQMMMNEDFSLAAMVTRERANQGGKPLTPEQTAEVTAAHKQIVASDKAVEARAADTEGRAATRQSAREHQALVAEVKAEPKPNGRVAKPKKTVAQITEGAKPDSSEGDLSNVARELSKHFIREGVAARDANIDAVHGELQKIVPDISRRQVMDAISLYGQYKTLNADPVAVKLREIAGEMQQVAKLEDMQAGHAPLKTGVERRVPTDEERSLIKQVNEAKKKGGFTVTDPARQLKSALDAVKTRLRNAITDLNAQIASRTKLIKTRRELKLDTEANDLKVQRDVLKKQFDEIFGKSKMTDAQKLAAARRAVEKSIADLEKRIAGKDFSKTGGKSLSDPALDSNRARLRALREQFNELKSLDPKSMQDAAARSLAAYKRSLADRAARLQEKLATNDFTRHDGQKSRFLDPEAKAALEANLKLKEQWQERLLNNRMKERLTGDIAKLKEGIISGVPPEKTTRTQRVLPPELRKLKVQKDVLRRAAEAKQAEADRTLNRKIWAGAGGLMRLLQTTGEFSFVGRQGGKLAYSAVGSALTGKVKPAVQFARAVGRSFRAAVNDTYAKAHDEAIFNNDNLPKWSDAKLRIIHEGEHISGTEELRISSWLDKAPVIRNINRAARIFFNDIRTSSFDALTRPAEVSGTLTPEHAQAIGHAVNVLTGYGTLGKAEAAAPVANTLFYSARNLAASFQTLLGEPLWRGDAASRKIVAGQYARILIGLGAVYAVGKLAGGDLEGDPRSSDFGKIRFGNTRLDPLMGLSQIIVFVTRELTGERLDAKGEVVAIRNNLRPLNLFRAAPIDDPVPFGKPNGADILWSFARSKASPNIGLGIDLLAGKDVVGQETGLTHEAGRFVPITYQDTYQAMKEQGVPAGSIDGVLAFFGMGLSTYSPQPPKPQKRNGRKIILP